MELNSSRFMRMLENHFDGSLTFRDILREISYWLMNTTSIFILIGVFLVIWSNHKYTEVRGVEEEEIPNSVIQFYQFITLTINNSRDYFTKPSVKRRARWILLSGIYVLYFYFLSGILHYSLSFIIEDLTFEKLFTFTIETVGAFILCILLLILTYFIIISRLLAHWSWMFYFSRKVKKFKLEHHVSMFLAHKLVSHLLQFRNIPMIVISSYASGIIVSDISLDDEEYEASFPVAVCSAFFDMVLWCIQTHEEVDWTTTRSRVSWNCFATLVASCCALAVKYIGRPDPSAVDDDTHSGDGDDNDPNPVSDGNKGKGTGISTNKASSSSMQELGEGYIGGRGFPMTSLTKPLLDFYRPTAHRASLIQDHHGSGIVIHASVIITLYSSTHLVARPRGPIIALTYKWDIRRNLCCLIRYLKNFSEESKSKRMTVHSYCMSDEDGGEFSRLNMLEFKVTEAGRLKKLPIPYEEYCSTVNVNASNHMRFVSYPLTGQLDSQTKTVELRYQRDKASRLKLHDAQKDHIPWFLKFC